uniref:Uncharacterized protein n=1 Tax=Arundo donax TaxID=35708 RepID=A0A0A9EXU5_ARUDO
MDLCDKAENRALQGCDSCLHRETTAVHCSNGLMEAWQGRKPYHFVFGFFRTQITLLGKAVGHSTIGISCSQTDRFSNLLIEFLKSKRNNLRF